MLSGNDNDTRNENTHGNQPYAGKNKPASYGSKYVERSEDGRGGAERQRSSGRAGRERNRINERRGGQKTQRSERSRPPSVTKKFSWWNRMFFRKLPWYKWLFRKRK